MITDKAKIITEKLYNCYGTDSGILLGISPAYRESVLAIVNATLEMAQELTNEEETP
jgi:hypothetical protein